MSRRRLILLFALLAAAHTWPLLPQAASHSLDDSDSLLNAWLLWKLLFGMTEYRRKAIRAIAFYWYAVIVLTIVVTLTVTSPAFAR